MKRCFFLFWERGPIHEIEMEAGLLDEETPGRRLKYLYEQPLNLQKLQETPQLELSKFLSRIKTTY